MSDVIGLHHRNAERIARREFPSLAEAREVYARYTFDQVQRFASKSFHRGEQLEPHEWEALLAYTRVRFAEDTDDGHGR